MRRWDFAVVRYLPTGGLDASFGIGGKAVHSVGDVSEDSAADMAVQRDSKILVVAAGIFGDVEFARPSHGHRLRASAEIEPREFRGKWAQGCRKEGKVQS
jgi:hypothetical protein